MKRNWRISYKLTQTLPILLLIILGGAIQASSQTTETKFPTDSVEISRKTIPADDGCLQRLDKTLDALEKCGAAKADVDAQLVTEKSLRAKEEGYNGELLKAVVLLTSAEKRNRSFFEKLRIQLGKVLMAATDPKTIAAIVSIIVIADRLKK